MRKQSFIFDRNSSGQVPYVATKDRQVRNEFRKFRAQFPERYDYEAAGVPAPLSEERETEKRAKEIERRKAMKKAKAARLKVGAVWTALKIVPLRLLNLAVCEVDWSDNAVGF